MNNLLLTKIYQRLCDEVDRLGFSWPVSFTYNPLRYAWDGFAQYLKYSEGRKRVVFLGINPGPWGMAQTGIPFGEINSVREFLGINRITFTQPDNMQVAYPVKGLDCERSEVSGKRLWGLFRERFGTAENFFADHFVLNYCPLLFITRNERGSLRNSTPDKINPSERQKLCELCDAAFIETVEILNPQFIVGIGTFAYRRAVTSLIAKNVTVTKILHPSPANPHANNNWAGKTTAQLIASGVWQ